MKDKEKKVPKAPQTDEQTATPEETTKHAAEVEGFKAKIEALEKDIAAAKDTLMRTAAEYDNHRKRSAKEHDAAFGNGVGFAVTQLLPIVDTLEIAAGTPSTDEGYKKGVEMTLTKCKEAFEKLEVKEIEALNKPFDPEFENAVLQQPAPEGVESGTVLQVMQKGYMLKDKVLRHAVVTVAE